MNSLAESKPSEIDFLEVIPENWINVGGRLGKKLKHLTERYPFICHGLSLSLGGPHPLNESLLVDIKKFLDEHHILIYSEHLSYSGDNQGHLYDLFPIPFCDEAVNYVAKRIQRAQEILERRIAIENPSYYCAPGKEIDEADFINAVLTTADCDLLLDVNNVYVNSVNHHYDARASLQRLQPGRIAYLHVAGHHQMEDSLVIDTHGADVILPVWQLLQFVYDRFGLLPTLLERDANIPPLSSLLEELRYIRKVQSGMMPTNSPMLHYA